MLFLELKSQLLMVIKLKYMIMNMQNNFPQKNVAPFVKKMTTFFIYNA